VFLFEFSSDGKFLVKKWETRVSLTTGGFLGFNNAGRVEGGSSVQTCSSADDDDDDEGSSEDLSFADITGASHRTTTTTTSTLDVADAKNNKWQHLLVSQPRCILCSKVFQEGDDVTHSNNPLCKGHEYHPLCLVKVWETKKCRRGNCPRCQEQYILDDDDALP
jgi:predicted Zn-ribbon and HTH transcriptional regulator